MNYKPGMKNPWLLQGEEVKQAPYLVPGIENLNLAHVTAILSVTYTPGDFTDNIGYFAIHDTDRAIILSPGSGNGRDF